MQAAETPSISAANMSLTDEQLQALGLKVPGYMPKTGDPNLPVESAPNVPLPASPRIMGDTQPQYPRSIMGNKIPQGAQIPTGPDAHAQGKEEYQEFMPQITASPGTTDYFRQRQEQLDYKAQHPWGDPISAHPGVLGHILHGLSVAGNIAGDIVAPRIMSEIPGTQLHNAELAAGNEKGIQAGEQKDIEQQQANTAQAGEKSREGLEGAQEKNLESEIEAREQGKTGTTPEELTIHDLMAGNNGAPQINPGTKKPYTYLEAYMAVQQAKQEAKPEKQPNDFEQFYGDYLKANNLPDSAASRLKARGEYAKAGQPFGAQHLQIDLQNQKDRETAANEKQNKPYQDVLDQYSEAQDFAKTPSPTNDYGLLMDFIGITKPESLGKIRLNAQELKLAVGTRSTLGDIDALEQKLANGEMLTPDQRKNMLSTMKIVADHAQKKLGSTEGGGTSKAGTKEDPLGIR